MTETGRPRPMIYLLVEAALILGLAYFTFIGGAISGLYLYGPRLVSQAIIGIVAGCWLASQFLRRRAWPASPIGRPLGAVLVVAVLATIFSAHPRLSLDATLIAFTYALAFWFLYDQMQAAWFADLLLKCLLIVGGIVCLIASNELLTWYYGLPNGLSWPSLNMGVWPPTPPRIGNASLRSPNPLAGYLASLIPLIAVRGLASSRPAKRVGFWALGLWMLGLIVVSQSRGGLLGALSGLAVLIVGNWGRVGEGLFQR